MNLPQGEIIELKAELRGDVGIGFRLPGQLDAQADGTGTGIKGTAVGRLHHTRASTGHHHVGMIPLGLPLGDQASENACRVVVGSKPQLLSTSMQLALQTGVSRIGGKGSLSTDDAILSFGWLKNIHSTKDDDRGFDSLSLKNLLRLGDFKQHANPTHLLTLQK